MATVPTRIDQDLFEAARTAGEPHGRSASQQIARWARVGRELEASPSVTHSAMQRLLAGHVANQAIPPADGATRRERQRALLRGRNPDGPDVEAIKERLDVYDPLAD
jgi:hypothetical protein